MGLSTDTQPSTIDYYHEERIELLKQISDEEQPVCSRCDETDTEKLHIHHVNPDEGHGHSEGGWQHLYNVKNDLENGVAMRLLCAHHHIVEHRERNDLTPLTRYES